MYILISIVVILLILSYFASTTINAEGFKDYNPYQEIFKFDYDYQLDPIQFKDKCNLLGLIDEYYGGKSDAYKDRYIPYILDYGFYELNRDY